MIKYPKIYPPYKRHLEGPDRNKLDIGNWFCPEFEILRDTNWQWTEKIDGTNIRIHWDGQRVTYGGRTDSAQLPAKLLPVLDKMFPEEAFEQIFGGDTFTFFGEGYGAGIESGGVYRPDLSFILFDIYSAGYDDFPGTWLRDSSVRDIADQMGIDTVPSWGRLLPEYAVDLIKYSDFTSRKVEGIVGRAPEGLLNRKGERIMMKIKVKDFR